MIPLPPATLPSARRTAIPQPLPSAPEAPPLQASPGSRRPSGSWDPHLQALAGAAAPDGSQAQGATGWGPPSAPAITQRQRPDAWHADRFPPALHALWTIENRDRFIDSSHHFPLPMLTGYIAHYINGHGLTLPADKVFALLDASAERTSRKQFVKLLEPLHGHALRAFADYEARRTTPPPGWQLDDWLPARSASVRVIGVIHHLPEDCVASWIDACAPVVARMHWAHAVEKLEDDNGGAIRILLRTLNSILQLADAAPRERLLQLIAVGMATNRARFHTATGIEPMKLSRVVCRLPTGPGGSAILTQLLLKTGVAAAAGIYLDADRQDDELFRVLMALGKRRTASPLRDGRPCRVADQPWPSQPGGTLVLYFGGLLAEDFYRYAGWVLNEFCATDHDDCLEFGLDQRFTGKHRSWLQDNARQHDMLEIMETPTSLAYIRGRHQHWLQVPPTDSDSSLDSLSGDEVASLEDMPAPADFGEPVSRRRRD